MTANGALSQTETVPRAENFDDWRARLDRDQIPPIIAIAGSRGKTSVLRAVESIFRAGAYRFASWTDRGVEIEGENQSGELGPWARALTRLSAGGLDVLLQEVDWATLHSLGPAATAAPVFVVSNLCANSEACLATPETLHAMRYLDRIRKNVAAPARLILNADDYAVAGDEVSEFKHRVLIGISPETPVLRQHLYLGGDACWVEGSTIIVQDDGRTRPLLDMRWLRWARGGALPFAVQTALLATAVTRACGLPDALIATGLAAHTPRPESMPGSFNIFPFGPSTIVVDRPASAWFLRATLRASATLGAGRHLRVVGTMPEVSTEDLQEIGRLLGRSGGVLIVHGPWTKDRLDVMRAGAATNDVPPIVLQSLDERSAIHQGMSMLRADDVMLVLAENPAASIRLIAKQIRRADHAAESVGAA